MRLRRSGGAFIYLSAFSFSLTNEFPLSAVSFVSVVVQKELNHKGHQGHGAIVLSCKILLNTDPSLREIREIRG